MSLDGRTGHSITAGDHQRGILRGPGQGCSGATAINAFPRQALHAATLGFVHPVTDAAMRFEAPLAADMQDLLAQIAP